MREFLWFLYCQEWELVLSHPQECEVANEEEACRDDYACRFWAKGSGDGDRFK